MSGISGEIFGRRETSSESLSADQQEQVVLERMRSVTRDTWPEFTNLDPAHGGLRADPRGDLYEPVSGTVVTSAVGVTPTAPAFPNLVTVRFGDEKKGAGVQSDSPPGKEYQRTPGPIWTRRAWWRRSSSRGSALRLPGARKKCFSLPV
jgi:hypothetical protein